MEDLAEAVVQQLRVADGPSALELIAKSPRGQPVLRASSCVCNGSRTYNIAVLCTDERGWERYAMDDIGSAVMFFDSFLRPRQGREMRLDIHHTVVTSSCHGLAGSIPHHDSYIGCAFVNHDKDMERAIKLLHARSYTS